MLVTEYIIAALRDQGVDHCFMDCGGLNDNFMPPMTETEGFRTIVAAFDCGVTIPSHWAMNDIRSNEVQILLVN
jgi:hypothetical protein